MNSDPLEQLRKTADEIHELLVENRSAFDMLKAAGLNLNNKMLGDVATTYAYLKDLQDANMAIIGDYNLKLKRDITEGEIALRKNVGYLLDQVLEVLTRLRNL